MKVHFRPLCFYETSTLVPVYTNQNKSKKDFHFYKKKKKSEDKIALSVCFAASPYQASTLPGQREGPHPAPSAQNYTQHLSIKPP